ncbi:T9SS type A sorting domain-containing protein [Reichenbachiella sp. MSK19-1]|uniref:T9SS type A sorting domain-containing protein n=1 Tax=Reichenbachiella sp. MSK19-1 TaxID=1897631 RepID=UPI000E6CF2FF|nr:T9SS type A sorting domain-containing protein [Reichenbachiella sp. MSK19-1]RJE70357.1 hypothetical protein BGP76_09675 [Reichenbachiella sp. MSK19-1]
MKKLLIAILLLITGVHLGFGQCPSANAYISGTTNITSDCTVNGNLSVGGSGTLNVSAGVTLTITGTLTISGGTVNATGGTINADQITEQWAESTLFGGTYNVFGVFNTAGNVNIEGITANVGGNVTLSGEGSNHQYINSEFNIQGNLAFGGQDHYLDGSTFNVGLGYADATSQAMTLSGSADLNMINNAVMNVNGNVNAGNSAEININNSTLHIYGNLDNAGDGDVYVTNGGVFRVDGDYDNSGTGSTTVDDGNLTVGGDYNNTGGGNTSSTNNGEIQVDGEYNNTDGSSNTDSGGTINAGSCTGGCPPQVSESPALPVELISFNLAADESNISITWQTASEINNDYFNLYRSDDGLSFEIITTVDGHGTTNEVQNYSYTDYPAVAGTYYYKLQQVDYDGVNEFFDTKRIEIGKSTTELTVYPVPLAANQDFYVQYSETNETVDARIYDLSGNLQYQLSTERESNKIRFASSELGLSPGIYVVQIQLGQNITTQKIRLY